MAFTSSVKLNGVQGQKNFVMDTNRNVVNKLLRSLDWQSIYPQEFEFEPESYWGVNAPLTYVLYDYSQNPKVPLNLPSGIRNKITGDALNTLLEDLKKINSPVLSLELTPMKDINGDFSKFKITAKISLVWGDVSNRRNYELVTVVSDGDLGTGTNLTYLPPPAMVTPLPTITPTPIATPTIVPTITPTPIATPTVNSCSQSFGRGSGCACSVKNECASNSCNGNPRVCR